jgi:hypothetical protein
MTDTPGWGAGWGDPPPGGGAPGWGSPPAWGPVAAKPGVIPLRPLGIGEILDGAITSIRQNPRAMLGLAALLALVIQLISVPLNAWLLGGRGDLFFSLEDAGDEASVTVTGADFIAPLVDVVTTGLAVLILTGVLTVVVSRAALGERMDLGTAWRLARPRLPALLGVTILVPLMMALAAVVLIAPAVVVGFAGSALGAGLLGLIGGLALIVALAYIFVAFSLAPVVVVLEKQGVIASLKRSRRLAQPGFWRILGVLLLMYILAQVISFALSVPFSLLALGVTYLTGGDPLDFAGLLPGSIPAVGTVLASAIGWPFVAAGTAILYIDQRMRREGLDLELARASGVAVAGASATPGTPYDGAPVPPPGPAPYPPPYGAPPPPWPPGR